MFAIRPENLLLSDVTTKHASNSPVTFVTHESFAILFFLPSCCVISLLLALCTVHYWTPLKVILNYAIYNPKSGSWPSLDFLGALVLASGVINFNGFQRLSVYTSRGGTPIFGYIGTCRGIGYGFWGSRSLNRVSCLTILFLCPWYGP